MMENKCRVQLRLCLFPSFPSLPPSTHSPNTFKTNMRTFSFAAISAAALVLLSSAPGACGAAIAKRDAASEAQSILDDARSKIAPIKESELHYFQRQT